MKKGFFILFWKLNKKWQNKEGFVFKKIKKISKNIKSNSKFFIRNNYLKLALIFPIFQEFISFSSLWFLHKKPKFLWNKNFSEKWMKNTFSITFFPNNVIQKKCYFVLTEFLSFSILLKRNRKQLRQTTFHLFLKYTNTISFQSYKSNWSYKSNNFINLIYLINLINLINFINNIFHHF